MGFIPNVSRIQTHNGGSDVAPDAANALLLIRQAASCCPDMQSA